MKPKLLDRPFFHLAIIAFLGLLAYSDTFDVPFTFDDQVVLESSRFTDISNVPSMFVEFTGPWASRPLLHATMAINYYLGRMDTTGYHAVNLALHLLNGILLYLLVVMTGRRLKHEESDIRPVALLSALLFLVHPAQTEAVTYVTSRSALFATTFCLLGLVLFLKAVTSETKRGLYVAFLFIVSMLGMGSREDFATFPLMLFLYDLFFVSRFRLIYREISPRPSFLKRGITSLWKREVGRDFHEECRPRHEAANETVARHYWAYVPVLLSLAYMAHLIINNTYTKSAAIVGIPPGDYALTQFKVHWTYLRLLVLPLNQDLDYDYPISNTLIDLPTFISFAGYAALWFFGIVFARRRPLAAFSVLWFLAALLPISFGVAMMKSLKLNDVIFEHRLYLPAAAFFPLAAAGLLRAGRSFNIRSAAVVALPAVLAAVLISATVARNEVWRSEIGLWEDVVEKSPRKARGHYNLGFSLYSKGFSDRALDQYKIAVKLKPDYAEAHIWLGAIYLSKGQYDEAIEHFRHAANVKENFADAYYNLGNAYRFKGLYDEAIEQFQIVLKLNPNDPETHNNLGRIYQFKGLTDKAMQHFEIAVRLKPDFVEANYNLELIRLEKEKEKQAGN